MFKLPRFFSPATEADKRLNRDRYDNALIQIVEKQQEHPIRDGDYIQQHGDYSVKISCNTGRLEIINIHSGELLYSFKVDVMNPPTVVENLLMNDRFVTFSISGYLNSQHLICIELVNGVQYDLARLNRCYQPIQNVNLNGTILEVDYNDAFCHPPKPKKATFNLEECAKLNLRELDEEASMSGCGVK